MAGGSDEVYLESGIPRWTDLSSKVSAVCHLALLSVEHTRSTSEARASGFLAKCKVHGRQETVVVTNNHFIETKEAASRVKATFHFDGDRAPKCVTLNPDIFFTTSRDLDYTMVGICESTVNDLQNELNVLPVKLEEKKICVKVDDVVHIPQHPGGKQKRFSSSVVKYVDDEMVCYKADTDKGSSGSPVLCIVNDNIVVLALHKTGGSKLPNGQLVNKGILISGILHHVNGNAGSNIATSPGNESGAFFDDIHGTTNQGLPVVQPQSAQPSTLDSEAQHNVSLKVKTGLVQETLNPSSTSSSTTRPSLQVIRLTQEVQDPQRLQIRERPCLLAFTQRELIRIAHQIADVWQQVAKETELFKGWEITNIRLSSSLHNEVLKADKMLNDFKSRLGTREILAEALKFNGKLEEAQHVLSGYFINNVME